VGKGRKKRVGRGDGRVIDGSSGGPRRRASSRSVTRCNFLF
jgi:hypothetical protein